MFKKLHFYPNFQMIKPNLISIPLNESIFPDSDELDEPELLSDESDKAVA